MGPFFAWPVFSRARTSPLPFRKSQAWLGPSSVGPSLALPFQLKTGTARPILMHILDCELVAAADGFMQSILHMTCLCVSDGR